MNHKAGFQFIGDWAKGKYLAAGKKLGTKADVGCMLMPGTQDFYLMIGDLIAMLAGVKAEVLAAQKTLAEIVMGKEVQMNFAPAEGSIPFRADVATDHFDECAQMDIKVMSKPAGQVPHAAMALRNEVSGAVTESIAKYWNTPSMTPQQGAELAAAAMKRAQ